MCELLRYLECLSAPPNPCPLLLPFTLSVCNFKMLKSQLPLFNSLTSFNNWAGQTVEFFPDPWIPTFFSTLCFFSSIPIFLCFPILFPVVSPYYYTTFLFLLSAQYPSLPPFLPVVITPSSRIMLEWSNCPRMPASLRKERRCLSEQPALNVFMATGSSLLLGNFRQPRHTSPKSPVGGDKQRSWSVSTDAQKESAEGEKHQKNARRNE